MLSGVYGIKGDVIMQKCDIKNMLYKCNLKSRALSVILYLIDRANKDLVCFPSIKTISKDLNISVSTTKRALNSLVETGFIEKIERFLDTTGKQTSNLYVINVKNIENVKNVDKVEKVTKQEEQEVLEMFAQATTNETKTKIKNTQVETNNKNNISTKIKEKINIKFDDRISTKYKNEVGRDNLLKNIDKNLFILELVKTLCSFKCLNFKNTILKNVKKLVNMKELLNFREMNHTTITIANNIRIYSIEKEDIDIKSYL